MKKNAKKMKSKNQPKIQKNNLAILTEKFNIHKGNAKRPNATIYIIGSKVKAERDKIIKTIVMDQALDYQSIDLIKADKRVISFVGQKGLVWILTNQEISSGGHYGSLDESTYAFFRDQVGSLYGQIKNFDEVQIVFENANEEIMRACIIGLELAAYQFLPTYLGKPVQVPNVYLSSKKSISNEVLKKSQVEAISVQFARHLVNLPPNEINPDTVEKMARQIKFPSTMKIEVWGADRLKKENMGLHLAVGAGSETPPRMIHFKYRPKKSSSKKPIAFVGKGVTFDTGGLDIKPSSAMRLMKKDMGGSAAVFALAYWCAFSNYHRPCDFYLALAENSVDAKSMRPSDVYTSRAGYTVEIDNTDAEGRLVLADVMDVAVTQSGKDEPEILVDVATLTGAIKVALGAEVAGIFSNDDKLAESMTTAGQRVGEPNWRIPLVKKYFSGMNSNFADFKNSADGFGGAITAALFLEKFIRDKKWVHMDVYCWNDKPTGALSFAGGNGQPVQTLIEWLKTQ